VDLRGWRRGRQQWRGQRRRGSRRRVLRSGRLRLRPRHRPCRDRRARDGRRRHRLYKGCSRDGRTAGGQPRHVDSPLDAPGPAERIVVCGGPPGPGRRGRGGRPGQGNAHPGQRGLYPERGRADPSGHDHRSGLFVADGRDGAAVDRRGLPDRRLRTWVYRQPHPGQHDHGRGYRRQRGQLRRARARRPQRDSQLDLRRLPQSQRVGQRRSGGRQQRRRQRRRAGPLDGERGRHRRRHPGQRWAGHVRLVRTLPRGGQRRRHPSRCRQPEWRGVDFRQRRELRRQRRRQRRRRARGGVLPDVGL